MTKQATLARIDDFLQLIAKQREQLLSEDISEKGFNTDYLKHLLRVLYLEIELLELGSLGEPTVSVPSPDVQKLQDLQPPVMSEPVSEDVRIHPLPENTAPPLNTETILPPIAEPIQEKTVIHIEHQERVEPVHAKNETVESPVRIDSSGNKQVNKEPGEMGGIHVQGGMYERLRLSRIDTLKKAISISKRYELQNELFQRDPDAYTNAIRVLDTASSLEEAHQQLDRMADQYGWEKDHELVEELRTILLRRYL